TIIPDAVQESYPESEVPNAEDGADEGSMNPPKRSTQRGRKPVQHQQNFHASIPTELANTMSFEDVLKLGMQLVSVNNPRSMKSLLPSKMDFAVGYFRRGCRPTINLLNFRLAHLKRLMNYINSPFLRCMCLPCEITSTENPKVDANEVAQLVSEIATESSKFVEDLNELCTRAKTGVTKIQNLASGSNVDSIIGTEERMEQVQEELMEQIKLVLVDLKHGGKIRPRSQDFMMEVIKSGRVPPEKTGEVDSHIISTKHRE
ncbi:unnamed protein product, partial [Allacma fusca]